MKVRMGCVANAAMVLISLASRGQTPAIRPRFEVASVRAASDQAGAFPPAMMEALRGTRRPGEIPMAGPDRVRLQDWTLQDLIAAAYNVRPTQVAGPAGLTDQRFDVEAKLPEGTQKDELNAMLQSLLEDRFGLRVHRASQSAQGFALIVGKDGPKLKASETAVQPAEQTLTSEEQKAEMQKKMQANMDRMMKAMQEKSAVVGPGFSTQSFHSITMENLAAQLVRFAGVPVKDETGLTGNYSVTVEVWNNPDVPGGTIFDAVEKLGLKLEPRKMTVESVVVEQVSKTPTAN
jgi:uncharacterized protein (TIGR03435 family)